MGYSTRYSLFIADASPNQLKKIHVALRKYEGAKWAFSLEEIKPSDTYETAIGCKWYKHESDMREVSKMFPHVLFTLSGKGEESGDIWNSYFLGGKCQLAMAQIIIAPFDPKELR